MNCTKKKEDCSALPFHKMKKIGYNPDTDAPIVRCTFYVQEKEKVYGY